MSPDSLETSTCLERLKALKAGSRLGAKDSSLFAGISGAAEHASGFMGWTDLSSNPPLSVEEIAAIADGIRADGLEAVVLLGQGGSSQASMTITKLNEVSTGRRDALAGDFVDALFSNRMQAVSVNDSDSSLDNVKSLNSTSSGIKHAKDAVTNNFASGVFSTKKTPEVSFRTMDSLSPVFVNHILGASDPARTLYIVSSKSGSTIEPLMLERVVWRYVTGHLGTAGAGKRFVAITDPGSSLEQHAAQRGYRLVLNSPKSVGGRFSALTVFALFPAALIGIDIISAIKHVSATEAACRKDDDANPASKLACFIYSNYLNGRDKLSFVMPSSGQVFGLWLEQLVAESLGKMGIGILPNVEVDASILSVARNDRCVITYELGRVEGFHESIQNFDPSIPVLHFSLDSINELFARFVEWEYATAMLGILLGVNPFDQPDVEDTKKRVRQILNSNLETVSNYRQIDCAPTDYVRLLRISDALWACRGIAADIDLSIDEALRALLASLQPNDYFSINAFLPFRGYGRREAMERMRNRVASRLGNVACLEIGPRYLHSTGQLHKGGPNNGVYLYLSADEPDDIGIPGENFTLGILAATQARGDFEALAFRGRRALQVHLAGNDSETLARFADRLCLAVSAIM